MASATPKMHLCLGQNTTTLTAHSNTTKQLKTQSEELLYPIETSQNSLSLLTPKQWESCLPFQWKKDWALISQMFIIARYT